MDKDCVAELVERLRYYAQNNEMIDQHFTESGRGLCEAAAALEQLQAERDAMREALTRAAGNLKVSAEFHGCANCKEGWKLARAALAAQEPKT